MDGIMVDPVHPVVTRQRRSVLVGPRSPELVLNVPGIAREFSPPIGWVWLHSADEDVWGSDAMVRSGEVIQLA